LAVFRAVANAPHASADVVTDTVRGDIGSISVQAVYDALATLTEKGFSGASNRPGRPLATRTESGTTTTT
jgi:Fur family transcriptional regulator, stress-responsive regulator